MQHTIWGRNGKKLEDDLFVDVDPINYEVCYSYLYNGLRQPPEMRSSEAQH